MIHRLDFQEAVKEFQEDDEEMVKGEGEDFTPFIIDSFLECFNGNKRVDINGKGFKITSYRIDNQNLIRIDFRLEEGE